MKKVVPELHFLTHPAHTLSHSEQAARVLAGGLTCIQFRWKGNPVAGREEGKRIRELCYQYGACFIVNDHPRLALELDADGLHLGQTDMHPAKAREILGPDKIIGLSTHNKNEIMDALNAPVDYIGLGPVFPTRTKETGYPVLGREGLQSLAAIANVPVIAIGGIHLENLPGLLNSGIRGLAFTSLLLDRENPEEAAAKLIQMWKTNKIAEHAKR